MKIFKRIFAITAVICISTATYAQMTDQQIVEQFKGYRATGMTKEQMLTDLAGKGVTKEQFDKIKSLYDASIKEDIGTTGTTTTSKNNSRAREQAKGYPANTGTTANTSTPGPGNIFGRALFSSNNLTFQPTLNLPTPENYQLGAGDEIIVDVWGNSEQNFKQSISPEGNINVPNIGPIFLNGLQVKEATVKIKRAFSRIYSDLASANPRTYIKISLGNIRSIQVNIMGEVAQPGTYTLSSFASVFHALYAAGGINETGSLRDIKTYREGKQISNTDIYEYLLNGDNSQDITLKEGDIVKVEPFKKRVQIVGMVKRPMIYEIKDNESLATLIDFAGGFLSNAYKKNFRLVRQGDTQLKIYTVDSKDFNYFTLQDGDLITIDNILEKYENKAEIAGSVFRPGAYAVENGIRTLKDLINIAEGPTEDAFLSRALLYRENTDLTITVESIDLTKLFKGEIADITLRKNDRLYIPSNDELIGNLYVTLSGEVKRPNNYAFAENMSIEDLILQGGGFLESSSLARIEVSRRIKNPMSKTESAVQSEIFNFSLEKGLIISGAKNFLLKPFDIVTVRKSPGYETQQFVTIRGEVIFGGSYPKIKRDERLSSFIQRAGGLNSSAYIKGARLIRLKNEDERAMEESSLRLTRSKSRFSNDSVSVETLNIGSTYNVGIDLAKAIAKPGSDDDVVLREGDVIDVPAYSGVVKVSGAVMYPNSLTYIKSMTIGDYIDNAGGYAFRAKKSRVYVVYMNNKISKGLGSNIEPGCEIIVPMKPERKVGISTAEVLGVSTSFASIIALIASILMK